MSVQKAQGNDTQKNIIKIGLMRLNQSSFRRQVVSDQKRQNAACIIWKALRVLSPCDGDDHLPFEGWGWGTKLSIEYTNSIQIDAVPFFVQAKGFPLNKYFLKI